MIYNDIKSKNLNKNRFHSYKRINGRNEFNSERHEKVLNYSIKN